MEEESKLRRPRKCLGSLIALIRLLGEVIGRVDWLHSGHGADKKMWVWNGARRSNNVEEEAHVRYETNALILLYLANRCMESFPKAPQGGWLPGGLEDSIKSRDKYFILVPEAWNQGCSRLRHQESSSLQAVQAESGLILKPRNSPQ
jgi:hypothetical protein